MNDQDNRGTIRTRSGTWEWTLKTFSTWPKSNPTSSHLRFEDPADRINTMAVRIESEADEFSADSVQRLSMCPSKRRFQDASGDIWIAHPVEEAKSGAGDAVRRISLHSLDHPTKISDLPPGRTLGDVKNKELVQLV